MGSGGRGGGSYFPSRPDRLQKLVDQAKKQAEQDRVDSAVNEVLQKYLIGFNDRDADKTREHLNRIADALGNDFDFEQLLLGGSVAKHTYVDGLSDVDALIIFDRDDLKDKSPAEVLKALEQILDDKLTRDFVERVDRGSMAVTVTHHDGTEIQLLPAMRRRDKVAIPDRKSKKWQDVDPKAFQRALTDENQRLNSTLVPTIKLAKAVNAGLPREQQLSGYHCEALALDVFKSYEGPKTPKAMLTFFFHESANRVLQPLPDKTGQSPSVDDDLGPSNSALRRSVSNVLTGVASRMRAATGPDQWKDMLEGRK